MSERRSPGILLESGTLRTFVLEQRIRYSYESPVTDVRQHLRIVPPAAHGTQRCRSWELRVDGVETARRRSHLDRFGNVTTRVSIPAVRDAVEFVARVEAESGSCPDGGGHAVRADPRYLRPTALTAADGAIAALAARSGDGPTPDIATVCDRVHASIAYEWGITGVHTTAVAALAGGRGVCQDYAHIMLAACRSAGIAARYVSGHLVGEGGSHAWIEVLEPVAGRPGTWWAEGWDPTHNRRTNGDYLVVGVGRDYRDAAPLSGTYEGDGIESSLTVTKRLTLE